MAWRLHCPLALGSRVLLALGWSLAGLAALGSLPEQPLPEQAPRYPPEPTPKANLQCPRFTRPLIEYPTLIFINKIIDI